MPSKSAAKRSAKIPARFQPRFWGMADQRQVAIREIRRRLEQLTADAGIDSFQKELIAQRAIFISVQLETMETNAAEGGEFDPGVYTQMSNSLLGLLRTLGLDRKPNFSSWDDVLDGEGGDQ